MAAGPVMSSVKANPTNATATSSTNRYSLFDGLDHIASTPPDLSLGPPSFKSSRRIEDETIRRLSASLNNLISQQHGLSHLPELPIPTYDNGNVDVSVIRPVRRPSPLIPHVEAEVDSSHARVVYNQEQELSPRVSDISSELDVPLDYRVFNGSSHLLAHVDSPVKARFSSLPCPSTHKSRPVSMYSNSTARKTRCHKRPDTSTGSQAGHHKKAISYSEQRYSPTRQQESGCPEDLAVRQDSVKGQTQRRFRLLPSLKNLHAHAKSHAKRLTVEDKSTTHDKSEPEVAQVMDIHSALRLKGISPLHDPNGEQDLSRECHDGLDSRPDSRQRPERKLSAPGLNLDTTEFDLAAEDAYQPLCRHKSHVSEAPTVDTDILNSDWPQPPTTHPPLPVVSNHQHFGPPLPVVMAPTTQQCTIAPSPPPTYPLPPVPSAATTPSKQPSKRSLVNPLTNGNLGLSLKRYNLPNTKSACSKTNNRIKALAANRGLSVDACLNTDSASSDCEMAGDAVVDPLPSPLNARFNQTSRSSKVRELKKRHLSLLHKDLPVPAHSSDKLQGRAVPGSASSKVPTSVFTSTTKELPKRPAPFDQRKPLPQIPVAARHRRSSEASASVTKANIGKSRHMRSASARSGGSGRQDSEADQDASLALSEVMVMVDSSPRQSRDFRAGAIRVPRQSRRKSSISKGQTLPALRYQPGQKRQSQPRVSSSLPIRDRMASDTSLTVTNSETRIQSDIVTTFIIPRRNSGTISPSKASSILEPSPISVDETDRYKSTSQRSPTPVRHVRNRQYVPVKDASVSGSPSTGKDHSASGLPATKDVENEQLFNEINRMVHAKYNAGDRKESVYGLNLSSTERLRAQRMARQRARPSSRPAVTTIKTTSELLDHIEADLIKANLSTDPSSPSSKRTTTLQPRKYDDSDVSITPKSSFRSTCSESSNKQARKNSDASMTDPNDYEGAAAVKPAVKDTSRVIILSTPPRSRTMDTTIIKSKKRYSNMPSWAGRSRNTMVATSGPVIHSDPLPMRETPYSSFKRAPTYTLTPPKYSRAAPETIERMAYTQVTMAPRTPTPGSEPDTSSEIELNHFLTEADQMDNAIDSFIQSTSRSASSTTSSCRSRVKLEISNITSSPSVTISSQRATQLRAMASTTRDPSQRYSAMSTISNIVDLQRIQDQIDEVSATVAAAETANTSDAERSVLYGLAMGAACREECEDDFGRISLVVRPRTT